MKLLMDAKSLCMNRLLAPPYALSHTHKKAPNKAACIFTPDDPIADAEVCAVKQD